MRYEIVHDTLARQILDRVSGEAKARRQAELLVTRAYKRYTDRGILLTPDDLDEIRPHEQALSFSPEEQVFIQKSKEALQTAVRRKRQILIGIITVLSVFLVFALWQWQRSIGSTKALQAAAAYEAGYISEAFRLAQSAYRTWGIDANTNKSIKEVLQNIHYSGLQRDLIHPDPVRTFEVDPKEKNILSIARNTAYIWDMQARLTYTLEHPVQVIDGSFVPWDSTGAILTIAADSIAYFWDGTGRLIRKQQLKGAIKGYAFSQSLKLVLLWAENDLLLLSDTINIWSVPISDTRITQAGLSPKGDYLLMASPDSVKTWWLLLHQVNLPPQPRIGRADSIKWAGFIASDASQLAILTQSANGTSRVYDYEGQPDSAAYKYLSRELSLLPPVKEFVFSQPGFEHPKVLFMTDSSSVRYWSAYRVHEDGERAGNLDFYTRYDQQVLTAQFSREDQYLLTSCKDGRVDIWDTRGVAVTRFKRFKAQVLQARFAHKDRTLFTRSGDNTIKIWNLNPQKALNTEDILHQYDEYLQMIN